MINYHGRFVWYELLTTDTRAAEAFYTKVIGWGTQDATTPALTYTVFTAGRTPAAGLMALPENARQMRATPRWFAYVGVDDVDAAADRLKRLGGAVQVPPMDIPNVSRFSIIADPQTATLGLVKWRNPGQRLAEPGTPGHVGWHELLAADGEKAFAFYRELFDWQKSDANTGPSDTYHSFSAGGQTIGGIFTKPPTVPVPFWLYYFTVSDIEAAAERVRTGGGEILDAPLELPGGSWIARCSDPQGAMFALEGKRSPNAIGYFAPAASLGRPVR